MGLPLHLASVQDAISVAVDIARELGVSIEEPVSLRSTNNAVAWLRPADIVAKVSIGSDSRLHTELQVAQELSAFGAPVVSLAAGLPAVVHRRDGFDVTFWKYHDQETAIEPSQGGVARSLSRLHADLDRLSPMLKASLPSYMDELNSVRRLLADAAALPALAVADRELLTTTFDQLKAGLDRLAPADKWVVIHGSPHSYNVLTVGAEPVFIDFETTCWGPSQWDFAHLEMDADRQVPGSDEARLLSVCQKMLAVKTATLCATEIDRGDMREHAEYHLAALRKI